MRALSAINLALWDLLGKSLGVLVYRLLWREIQPTHPGLQHLFRLRAACKIASLADAFQLPVAPHTAGGPLPFYASTRLTTAAANVWIQESVQQFYESDWPKLLENPIVPEQGTLPAPELPGFGMQRRPDVWSHPAAGTLTQT